MAPLFSKADLNSLSRCSEWSDWFVQNLVKIYSIFLKLFP